MTRSTGVGLNIVGVVVVFSTAFALLLTFIVDMVVFISEGRVVGLSVSEELLILLEVNDELSPLAVKFPFGPAVLLLR